MAETFAPGIQEMNDLQAAGFTGEDIDKWKTETTTSLQDAGFNSQEVDDYFGVKKPDMKPTEEMFKKNLAARAPQPAGTPAPAADASITAKPDLVTPDKPQLKEAHSFLEAIEAGFDMSVTGLMRGRPDVVLPEHAPMYYRIASQVSQLAGDFPAMVAGSIGGGAAGGAAGAAAGTVTLPVVGTVGLGAAGAVAGAGAGSFALPEAMRTVMMEHYEKGDVQSFSDFWERTSAVAINSLKAGTVGAVTAGVGGVAAKVAGGVVAPVAVKTTAQLMSEVTTMTTVGAALDGRVPEPSEFIDASILVLGFHGATHAAGKVRSMYAKGGATPVEIAQAAATDPKLKQEMAASNVPTPNAPDLGVIAPKLAPPEKIETVKPLREKNPNLSESVNTILGKVGEQPDAPKKSALPTTSELYTNFVDKLDPINEATKTLAGKKSLTAEENPYILARTSVDYKSKAKHFFENGTFDFKTFENNGPGLKEALKSVDSVETLEAYMISKRVLEKTDQGLKMGFDLDAARKVVGEHAEKYEAAAQKVTDFSNRVLDYVAQSGVLSPEAVGRMKDANKDYVPFKRIMDVDESGAPTGKRPGKAGSLKEMTGSERAIQSPIMSIVENTVELAKMAETNRPKAELIKLANKTEGQELIRSVKAPMEAIEVKASEIVRHLENSGAITTIESIKKGLKEKGLKIDDEAILKAFEQEQGVTETSAIKDLTIFRKAQTELAPNQFSVFENGKRKVYETTPELAEALKRLDGDSTSRNLLFKVMHGITSVKKIGITFTPDFVIRNFMRDTMTAATFSKSKGIHPGDIASAIGDIWKKNDNYYDWLKSGGANGSFTDLGEKYVKNDFYKLSKETGLMQSARNIIEKPIEVLRVAAELSEQSIRVAEYKKTRALGEGPVAGGFASREITVDFQRVGAKVSALNSITAFMNVQVQGLDRTARAFHDNPTATAAKAAAYITVPSLLLWWANKDDERYKEIPRWEKDTFWIIPTDSWQKADPSEADGLPDYLVRQTDAGVEINKGHIYRLPKPQELGIVFGSLPERLMEAFFTDHPDSFKDFGETLKSIVTPSFVPDAVAPAVEQYFNKSFFTGRDLVPAHLEGILPQYQSVEYTSETAKALGKMIGVVDRTTSMASPMILDNYIRSWGGAIGQYAVQVADKALVASGAAEDKVKPTSTLNDIPFIKSFVVRYPMAGTNSVQDFQTGFRESKQITDTIRYLAKQGDFQNLEKEMLLSDNQEKLVRLDGISEALKAQSNLIRLVSRNPDMTPDEKRQLIDSSYLMMTEAAKQGNEMMREIKKQLGEK